MLGNSKEWHCCYQYAQGFNFAWSTCNAFEFRQFCCIKYIFCDWCGVGFTSFWLLLKVLCSAWKDDGTTVFSGGCDKQAKMWPLLSGGQPVTVAMHDAPIKEIAWIPEMSLLATGSLDKTVKYAILFFLFSYILRVLVMLY